MSPKRSPVCHLISLLVRGAGGRREKPQADESWETPGGSIYVESQALRVSHFHARQILTHAALDSSGESAEMLTKHF